MKTRLSRIAYNQIRDEIKDWLEIQPVKLKHDVEGYSKLRAAVDSICSYLEKTEVIPRGIDRKFVYECLRAANLRLLPDGSIEPEDKNE